MLWAWHHFGRALPLAALQAGYPIGLGVLESNVMLWARAAAGRAADRIPNGSRCIRVQRVPQNLPQPGRQRRQVAGAACMPTSCFGHACHFQGRVGYTLPYPRSAAGRDAGRLSNDQSRCCGTRFPTTLSVAWWQPARRVARGARARPTSCSGRGSTVTMRCRRRRCRQKSW